MRARRRSDPATHLDRRVNLTDKRNVQCETVHQYAAPFVA